MKLHADPQSRLATVTAYGPGYVDINQVRYTTSVLVMPELAPQTWPPVRFTDLLPTHFEALLALQPELVLLGTGERQQFAAPPLTRALLTAGIGIEAMNTQAACRTYNILMAEGRRVLAALLLETPTPIK